MKRTQRPKTKLAILLFSMNVPSSYAAARLGLSASHFSAIVNGEATPSDAVLAQIAELFDVQHSAPTDLLATVDSFDLHQAVRALLAID